MIRKNRTLIHWQMHPNGSQGIWISSILRFQRHLFVLRARSDANIPIKQRQAILLGSGTAVMFHAKPKLVFESEYAAIVYSPAFKFLR